MYMCEFFVVNIIIIACAIKQHILRNSRIEHEFESSSIRCRKQYNYLYRVVYKSDVKCIDKLYMD